MGDIRIVWNPEKFRGDWIMAGPGLDTGQDLESAVLVSLFTHATKPPDLQVAPGLDDPRGWWGDAYEDSPIGSLLWTLRRAKKTLQTLRLAEHYTMDALGWMIEDGIASDIAVTAEWQNRTRLALRIIIRAPAGAIIGNYRYAWEVDILPITGALATGV